MKKLFFIFLSLISSNVFASEGFTWLSKIAQITGVEHAYHEHGIHHYEHTLTFPLVGIFLIIVGLVYRSKTVNPESAVVP